MSVVNLLELDSSATNTQLEIVRIGEDETPIIPFTATGDKLDLHYSDDQEIRGYLHCGGDGCPLCRIGRKIDQRILLPVFLPTAGAVGVLMVPLTRTPLALLPQLLLSLRSGRREILFLRRDGNKYGVTARPLAEGEEDGAGAIRAFLEQAEAGTIDLGGLVTRLGNDEIAGIPSIARHLALKGIA